LAPTFLTYRTIARPIRRVSVQLRDAAEGEGDLTSELAVRAMARSRQVCATSVQHALRTSSALDATRNAVVSIKYLNTHIAPVSEHQTHGADQCNVNAANIEAVARATVQDAVELGRPTGALGQIAEELERLGIKEELDGKQ